MKQMSKFECEHCGDVNPANFYGTRKICCKRCHNDKMLTKRKLMIRKARELLGGKCSICSYDKCAAALEFHHTDPTKKNMEIGSARYGWERTEKELKKCILICANCHREIHANLNGWYGDSSVTRTQI